MSALVHIITEKCGSTPPCIVTGCGKSANLSAWVAIETGEYVDWNVSGVPAEATCPECIADAKTYFIDDAKALAAQLREENGALRADNDRLRSLVAELQKRLSVEFPYEERPQHGRLQLVWNANWRAAS